MSRLSFLCLRAFAQSSKISCPSMGESIFVPCPASLNCLFCRILCGITFRYILSLKFFGSPRSSDYGLQTCTESWLVVAAPQERLPPSSFSHCHGQSRCCGEAGLPLVCACTEGAGSPVYTRGGVNACHTPRGRVLCPVL